MLQKEKGKRVRLSPVPPKLKPFIEMVNWLPAWFGVESHHEPPYFKTITARSTWEDRRSALLKSLDELTAEFITAEAERVTPQILARTSNAHWGKPDQDIDDIEERLAEFKEYILGGVSLRKITKRQMAHPDFNIAAYEETLREVELRYVNFYYTRGQLRTLVRFKEDIETLSLYRPTNFRIERKGHARYLRVGIEPDKLIDALDGIEFDRLRECRVCRRLFWAGRKDRKCCALPRTCGNIYRQRLLRG
ncbi:MAG TPA: hypothetical protein VK421_13335 [Pyrinomonadaceae bacterium]|nr:hypothetical protein [Pyrinomonadaceae bacterium]